MNNNVPIIGEKKREYWIGDKSVSDGKEPTAMKIELSVSPMNAIEMLQQYLAASGGKLEATFVVLWVYTSIATQKLVERCADLEKSRKKMLERLDKLERRLAENN